MTPSGSLHGGNLIATTLLASMALVAFADAQTITTFDVPNATSTQPAAINAAGVVAGTYSDSIGQHGFVREADGTVIPFDAPPPISGVPRSDTAATSINAVGQITGYVYPITYFRSGYIRQPDGTFVEFGGDCNGPTSSGEAMNEVLPIAGVFYDEGTTPTALNNKGQITGWCGPGASISFGFSRGTDGSITVFEPEQVPDPSTQPIAINSHGEITGDYLERQPVTVYRGFIREPDGTMTTFAVPSTSSTSQSTVVTAINSKGQITGYTDRGFLRQSNGKIVIFNVPHSISTQPASINAGGDITGVYVDENNLYHGFIRHNDGTIETFKVPNAINTYPTGINNKREITGWYSDAGGTHGFVRTRQ